MFYTCSVSHDDNCKSHDLMFLTLAEAHFPFLSQQTSLGRLAPRAAVRSGETLSALPSQNLTSKEGDRLESGSLRKKRKFEALAKVAKERHVVLSPGMLQLGPESATGQERAAQMSQWSEDRLRRQGRHQRPPSTFTVCNQADLGANFLPTRKQVPRVIQRYRARAGAGWQRQGFPWHDTLRCCEIP